MYLTTDNLDPDRQSSIDKIDKSILDILPKNYINLLGEYGAGTYCNEVYVTYPDSQTIPLTFKDYTDLWDLNDLYNVDDLLNSIQIGSTANGDIICVTPSKKGEIFALPRHDIEVVPFLTFEDTIKYFVTEISKSYFDPFFDSKKEQISLIKSSGGLIDISPIHEQFLENFSFDFIDESISNQGSQPKYFFKNFGGWVRFDLIYKNGIYIKFQNKYVDNTTPVLNFLKSHEEE